MGTCVCTGTGKIHESRDCMLLTACAPLARLKRLCWSAIWSMSLLLPVCCDAANLLVSLDVILDCRFYGAGGGLGLPGGSVALLRCVGWAGGGCPTPALICRVTVQPLPSQTWSAKLAPSAHLEHGQDAPTTANPFPVSTSNPLFMCE